METKEAPLVTWNESWMVGVQEIDAQHKHLVSLLNQLHQALSQGKGKDVLGGILDSLVRYTKAHFAAEERLMQQCGYPDIVAHQQTHVQLTDKVLYFQRSFQSGQVAMGVEIMQFLGSWLQGHIRGTDKKYAPFLHAKGVH